MNNISSEIKHKLVVKAGHLREEKHKIEHAVIGAILLESHAVHRIIDILDPKNFTGINQHIWASIINMYTTNTPIDLKSAYHQILKDHPHLSEDQNTGPGDPLAYHLAYCLACVNSAANIETHAMTIMELDISTKFYQLISSAKEIETSKVFQAIAMEVLDAIYQDKDKLRTLEEGVRYMHTIDPTNALTIKITEFYEKIQEKVDRIKKRERIRQAIAILTELHQGSGCEDALRESTNLLISIINSRKVPVGFTEEVVKLKRMVSQYSGQ